MEIEAIIQGDKHKQLHKDPRSRFGVMDVPYIFFQLELATQNFFARSSRHEIG